MIDPDLLLSPSSASSRTARLTEHDIDIDINRPNSPAAAPLELPAPLLLRSQLLALAVGRRRVQDV